jgi:predicted outer membrane repeat protein
MQGPGASLLTISGANASRVINFTSTGGSRTLSDLTITQGAADLGGAIRAGLTTISINNSAIHGNSASSNGGGLYLDASQAVLTNSTFSGNSSGGLGGGIYMNSITATLTNCTITLNRGTSSGGGGCGLWDIGVSPTPTTINNSIIAGNFLGTGPTPGDLIVGSFLLAAANNNLIGDAGTADGVQHGVNGNIVGNNGVGTIPIATILDTILADNGGPTKTHALVCNSLALNRGSNALAVDPTDNQSLTTDQRGAGFPRIVNTTVDIGAFEQQQACGTPPTITAMDVTRTAGVPAFPSQITTVSDAEDAAGSLSVTVNGATSATVNGVSVSGLSVNSSGQVMATVGANCTASTAAFTLRVTDSGGLFAEATLNVTVAANPAPTLGAYMGISVALGGSAILTPVGSPADNVSVASVTVSASAGFTGSLSVNPATGVVTVSDAGPSGAWVVTVTATDNCGVTTSSQFTLTVNAPPVVTITGPASGSIFAAGTPVNFSGTFTDNAGDTHTASWMFDDITQSATVIEPSGSTPGSANTTYTFTQAGVYAVKLTVTDNSGLSTTADTVDSLTALVVVYDPSAGWVAGHGWINSPAGAYLANPGLTGKAKFGFVSRYRNGASVPTGHTEFHFNVANFKFKSTSYEWLVVAGARAQYKGVGTINGAGSYSFILTAIDGQQPGGGGQDKFRIKIFGPGGVVYDNQMNDPDSNDPTTLLGGGNIQIHH